MVSEVNMRLSKNVTAFVTPVSSRVLSVLKGRTRMLRDSQKKYCDGI